jgi:hypothetical protein
LRILTMGSFREVIMNDCTLSFNFKQTTPKFVPVNTTLYTGLIF